MTKMELESFKLRKYRYFQDFSQKYGNFSE